MVDRYFLECGAMLRLADGSNTDEDVFVKFSDYQRLEAELATLKKEMADHAGMLLCEKHSNHWGEFYTCPCCRADKAEADLQRMVNIAGDALGFSQYQRDQDTVEVLANHCKRLGEELAAVNVENEKLRGDYSALAYHHDAAHSDTSRKELENELVLQNSLLNIIEQILDGKEPDDFSQSFPIIRNVFEKISTLKDERDALRARCERLEEALKNLVEKLFKVHDNPEYYAVWSLYASHIPGGYKGLTYTKELDEAKQALEVPNG